MVAHAAASLGQVDVTSQPWSEERIPALDEVLGSIEDDLKGLSEAITYFYFSHAELRVS